LESFADDKTDPATLGFDAAVEFQPDWETLGPGVRRGVLGRLARRARVLMGRAEATDYRLFDYASVVERMLQKEAPPYRRFPCVTPSWDNSARRRAGPIILRDSSPGLYERWLTAVLRAGRAQDRDDELVFVNAWNEWGEGCHLEPDLQFGRGYLEATRRALAAVDSAGRGAGERAATPAAAVRRGAMEPRAGYPAVRPPVRLRP
jgi:hypothetical protein